MRLLTRRGRSHAAVQVSEKDGVRFLHLDGPAVQSAMRIRAPFDLELEYTRAMMAFVLFHPTAREAALIGLGGGSIAKFIHRRLPQMRLTALEINPEVVAAARAHFLLPPDDERLQVRLGDGAEYVHAQHEALDVLLVDGYDAVRIVEALASPEFYRACARALRPGGVAVFNLWATDRDYAVYRQRIAQAFADRVLSLPAERRANVIVFGLKPPLPPLDPQTLLGRAQRWQRDLGLELPHFLARLSSGNPLHALSGHGDGAGAD
ncbi:MAG: fused MFS/spermidine synthase [Burkholderiales bacterium]|nr:fused MFS/spermidine synthase [Burkholderiales bacterium]